MVDWPKHENGVNKAIGEMTDEERIPLLKDAAARYREKRGFALTDAMKDHLAKIEALEVKTK
jgi:hypothetical protein